MSVHFCLFCGRGPRRFVLLGRSEALLREGAQRAVQLPGRRVGRSFLFYRLLCHDHRFLVGEDAFEHRDTCERGCRQLARGIMTFRKMRNGERVYILSRKAKIAKSFIAPTSFVLSIVVFAEYFGACDKKTEAAPAAVCMCCFYCKSGKAPRYCFGSQPAWPMECRPLDRAELFFTRTSHIFRSGSTID